MKCTPIVRHIINNWRCIFIAKFSSKDKIQAVKRYLEGTEGGKTIANSIGVHPRELYQWIKQFEFSGEKAFEKRYTTYPLSIN